MNPIFPFAQSRYHFGVFVLLFSFLAQQRSVAVAKPLSSQSNQGDQGKKDSKKIGTPPGTLFVIVVVDQMRSDYVSRFTPLFKAAAKAHNANKASENQGEGGFAWFIGSGANFTNARTASAPTVTAAGHASLCTGTSPILSGIPANEYFDREQDRTLPMVFDAQAKVIRTPGLLGKGPLESSADDGVSASKLRTAPLGERIGAYVLGQSSGTKKDGLGAGTRKGRSIALSMKDRAAMVCAGRNSDGAYYFDDKSGSMVTSSAASSPERTSLPEWVDAFNFSRRGSAGDNARCRCEREKGARTAAG
jgi:Type I phosphodiesterase / nucleotide pyrophosphatase